MFTEHLESNPVKIVGWWVVSAPFPRSGVNSKEAKYGYLTLRSIASVFSLIKIVKWYLLPIDMMIYLKEYFMMKKTL